MDLEKKHYAQLTLASLGAWFALLIIACVHEGQYWLLFQLAFAFVGWLPFAFDSHQSHGVWGAFGDFVFSASMISLFAFPVVLHNANQVIGQSALLIVTLSTLSFLASSMFLGRVLTM